ncbi:unnamed protein product [Spirodela intermedia]|uniref:Uncharacterized protein n=1 Tax=Spirodela intermedia TaxID=51605 RepID=A0A7I8LD39_SPIIN|nr:unnamed protein product [Spirodela intermedia]
MIFASDNIKFLSMKIFAPIAQTDRKHISGSRNIEILDPGHVISIRSLGRSQDQQDMVGLR